MKIEVTPKLRQNLTVSEALKWSKLPTLEAEMLLAHNLDLPRIALLTHPENMVNPADLIKFQNLVVRRKNNEPISYIVGFKDFYGLKIKTDQRALIPRIETEDLVEEALKLNPRTVADLGTGSGAVALALASALPNVKIYATDISAEALELAQENAALLGFSNRITFLQGHLTNPLPELVDLITANLPYVRNWMIDELPREIKDYEPRVALDGGDNGLILYNELFATAQDKLRKNGYILYELDGRIYFRQPQVS